MSKKALRKELEVILGKTIEEILHLHNPEAAKRTKKVISESSRTIAKKFYKTIKSVAEKKTDTAKKSIKRPVKTIAVKRKTKAKK